MQNLQFFHKSGPKFDSRHTIGLETPSKNDLLDLMAFGSKKILINLGISYVNPKDQYNRKTGRELTSKRLKPFLYQLKLASYNSEEQLELYLYCLDSPVEEIVLRISYHSNRVHFINASL